MKFFCSVFIWLNLKPNQLPKDINNPGSVKSKDELAPIAALRITPPTLVKSGRLL